MYNIKNIMVFYEVLIPTKFFTGKGHYIDFIIIH